MRSRETSTAGAATAAWLGAAIAIVYGFAKLNGSQFTTLDSQLTKPMGEVSGFWLTWYYFDYSSVYGAIIALAQILGGILMIVPATAPTRSIISKWTTPGVCRSGRCGFRRGTGSGRGGSSPRTASSSRPSRRAGLGSSCFVSRRRLSGVSHRRRVRRAARRGLPARTGGEGREMIRVARTEELDEAELRAIRELMDLAFGDQFTEDDWDHSLGGDRKSVV